MIVLVTGMSGLIGGALRRHLDPATYALRALGRRAVAGVPSHRANIADLDAIQPAFAGVDGERHGVDDRDQIVRTHVVDGQLHRHAPSLRESVPNTSVSVASLIATITSAHTKTICVARISRL